MSFVITRRTVFLAGLASALATAAIIAVTHAQARSVYACVKGSGAAHVFAEEAEMR